MSQENQTVLRQSLDAVDRHQKRLIGGVIVATVQITVATKRNLRAIDLMSKPRA